MKTYGAHRNYNDDGTNGSGRTWTGRQSRKVARRRKANKQRELAREVRARKRVTPEQVANDASLKFYPLYRHPEILWSDTHGACVRFGGYVPGDPEHYTLCTLNGIDEMPGKFHRLTVRRPG